MKIFNRESMPLMKKALEAYNMRQKVIANNIANATTEGYQRKEVVFEEKVEAALRAEKGNSVVPVRTHPHHIPVQNEPLGHLKGELQRDTYTGLVNGINNVDIDMEMADAAENSLRYQAVVQSIIQKYKVINEAIRGR